MSKEIKPVRTLTEDDIVTSSKVTRRSIIAGAGIAIGGLAIAATGRSAIAADATEKQEKDKAEVAADTTEKEEAEEAEKAKAKAKAKAKKKESTLERDSD